MEILKRTTKSREKNTDYNETNPIHRRWRVHYELAYTDGGQTWDSFYGSWIGAKIAALVNSRILSYGGLVELFDTRRKQ